MKIAIAGYGVEGQASYRYYASDEKNTITIVDQSYPSVDMPKNVKTIIGEDAFKNLLGFDLVIRTPGLPPASIKTDGKIWSATNEFFAKCPAPIIGITGTKGKGTTASLVASILNRAGKKVWLIGNIGIAALDVLQDIKAEDVVVYELSSFQLWDIKYSPKTAVLLFVEEEHLNIHYSKEDYFSAKMNITKFQTAQDNFVFYENNTLVNATTSNAALMPYPNEKFAHIKNDNFYFGEKLLGSTNNLKIIGSHNLENACAAINAVWLYTTSPETIMEGLADFEGLPHRLKLIGAVEDVYYYDDSIATTPSATIAALNAINKPKHLILGGSSKGLDYSLLAERMLEEDVLSAFLMGEESDKIAQTLDDAGFLNYQIISKEKSLSELVQKVHQQAAKGDAVLLSPAAASFGLFSNYIDRGNQFIKAVEEL